MEFKLNIYNELDEVEKTYTRNCYKLKMRNLKNVLKMIEFDKIGNALEEGQGLELVGLVSRFVIDSYEKVQELMQDIFPELTEEEYEDTHVDEVAKTLIDIVKYSFNVIASAGGQEKN